MGDDKKLKKLKCRKCGKYVENVGEKAKSVMCSDCVQDELVEAMEKQTIDEVELE